MIDSDSEFTRRGFLGLVIAGAGAAVLNACGGSQGHSEVIATESIEVAQARRLVMEHVMQLAEPAQELFQGLQPVYNSVDGTFVWQRLNEDQKIADEPNNTWTHSVVFKGTEAHLDGTNKTFDPSRLQSILINSKKEAHSADGASQEVLAYYNFEAHRNTSDDWTIIYTVNDPTALYAPTEERYMTTSAPSNPNEMLVLDQQSIDRTFEVARQLIALSSAA